MPITFYSGTPGSGKSYHMAKDIKSKLLLGRNIICSENIDLAKVSEDGKKKIGNFVCKPIEEMSPEYFYLYAYENHVKGKEKQTYIIMDECHRLFNPRDWGRKDRKEWLTFFSEHRHIGYEMILISQHDRQIDRQIRNQFEHEIKHRKINNMHILGFLFPTTFAFIEYYYGNKMVVSKQFVMFKKKIGNIYDYTAKFDDFIKRMDKEHRENKKTGYLTAIRTDADEAHPETISDCVTVGRHNDPQSVSEEAPTPLHPAATSAKMGRGPEGEGHPSKRPPRKVNWWMQSFFEAPIKGHKKAG